MYSFFKHSILFILQINIYLMGAFSDIFGKVPRVAILEILAENSDDELTIREIIDETEVSKRGVYLIIRDFIKNGLVLESGKRPKKYRLNKNDLRALTLIKAEPLLIMGKLEYELKLDDNIPINEQYHESYANDIDLDYHITTQFADSNYQIHTQYSANSNKNGEKEEYKDETPEAEPVGAWL